MMKIAGLTKKMWLTGVMLIGIVAWSSSAFAISLTNWNVTELNTSGDYVEVTVSGNDLIVQWFSGGGSGPTAIGIDMFGYDTPDSTDSPTVSGISGNNVTWSFNFDGGVYDGFDTYDSRKNLGGGETGGISSPLTFTLAGSAASITDFVAHVRYSNNCSGFVANNRTSNSSGSDSNCAQQVPEPSTLLLLGSDLVGHWRC